MLLNSSDGLQSSNKFDWVRRLGSQSNSHTTFLVRFVRLPNSIEPNRSIEFDYRTVRVVSSGVHSVAADHTCLDYSEWYCCFYHK